MERSDYKTLLVLFATLFLAVADNQILSPLLPLMSAELGVSIRWLGQLVTGYALAAGLVAFGLSPLSDRLGRPLLIRWALLLFAAASLISSQAGGFMTLLMGRLTAGVAAGILSFNVIAHVGDRFAYAQRGRAMGIVYSAYFAALVVGVPAGSWIADGLGWPSVFLGGCLAAMCLYIVALFFLTERRPVQSRPALTLIFSADWYATFGGFWGSGKCRRGIAASFLVSGGIVCFLTYLGAWLHQDHGMNTRQIGSLFMLSGLAALVASPLCGYLSDHIGKARAFAAGNTTAALCILFLPWAMARPVLLLTFFVLSLAAALRQSPFEAIITEVVGPDARGRYIAFRNMFSQVGIAVSVFIGGLLFQSHGFEAIAILAAALTGAASVIIPRVAD